MQQFENILPTTPSFPLNTECACLFVFPELCFCYVMRLCKQHVTTALHCVYKNNLLIHSSPFLTAESGMYN